MRGDATPTDDLTLAARSVSLERGERTLFTGLDLSAPAGALLRLSGANGTGKTSLLRVLAGLMPADSGLILYRGKPISDWREDYWRDLIYIGHLNGIKEELTPRENLALAARLGGVAAGAEAVSGALGEVGLADFADGPAGQLSQGQRRRVALARLFLGAGKPVWLLDEPFTALDTAAGERLAALIADHVADGGVVIYTTHREQDIPVPPERRRVLDVSGYAPSEGR